MKKPKGGEMLWEINFTSSYYDHDPRWPGTVPVGEYIYVLADGYHTALEKAEPLLKKLREQYKDNEISVQPVLLENLVSTRKTKQGRLTKIELSLEEDKKQYELKVCLVPVKKK